jgi:peptidoglycan/LPS O-acetylase OafA/YrhL
MLNLFLLKSGPVVGSFNAPAWSISVECICYALFYIYARQPDRVFIGFAAGTCLLGIVLTQNWHPLAVAGWWVARGLVGFFAGCLAYRAAPLIRTLPSFALILISVAGFAMSIHNPPVLHHISFFTRASLLCWVPLMIAATRPGAQRWGENWLSKFVGDHSFSIYLWHVPIAMLILMYNGGQPYPREHWVSVLLAHIIATLAVASVSFCYLERPAQSALRKRLAQNRRSSAPQRQSAY